MFMGQFFCHVEVEPVIHPLTRETVLFCLFLEQKVIENFCHPVLISFFFCLVNPCSQYNVSIQKKSSAIL